MLLNFRLLGGTVLAALAVGGCVGLIGEDTSSAPGTTPEPTPQSSALPLRALTPFELRTTLRDLYGLQTPAIDALQPEALLSNVETIGAANVAWTGQRVDALEQALYATATTYTTADGAMAACAAMPGSDYSCLREKVAATLRQLYRREIAAADVDAIVQVAATNAAALGRQDAIARALVAAWMSADHLYLTSIGSGEAGSTSLTPYELAGRLSYTLWSSAPDEALMNAARDGKLATSADVEAQATRMLADPKGRRGLVRFVEAWAGILNLGSRAKGSSAWSASLVTSGLQETERYLDAWLSSAAPSFSSLIVAERSFLNEELAAYYGVPYPNGQSGMTSVTLPANSRRHGLLSQLSFLGASTTSTGSSPTLRGRWVLEKLYCQPQALPPPNTVANGPTRDPNSTTREYHELLASSSGCSACHVKLEAAGFPFEIYDGLGKLRLQEVGRDVRNHTQLQAGTDIDGTFASEEAYFKAISQSKQAVQCMATHLAGFGLGRMPGSSDEALVSALADKLHGNAREALVALVSSEAFRHNAQK